MEQGTSSKAQVSQPSTTDPKGKAKVKCFKCNTVGHVASECPKRSVNLAPEGEEDVGRAEDKLEEKSLNTNSFIEDKII